MCRLPRNTEDPNFVELCNHSNVKSSVNAYVVKKYISLLVVDKKSKELAS